MADLIETLQQQANLPGPTQQDIDHAEAWLIANEGKWFDLGRKDRHGRVVSQQIYLSKSPAVREAQVRCWAMGYVAARENAKKQPALQVVDGGESKEVKAARSLMAGTIYESVTFNNPGTKPTELIRFLKVNFSNQTRPHLLLLGGTGCGKTYGAVCYLASKMDYRQTVTGHTWDGEFIMARHLSELSGVGSEKRETLERLRKVRYLLIDDLKAQGEGTVTKAFVALVEDLFNERHMHRKPTIITSNATLEEIANTYGERFVSRFKGDGVVYQTDEADMRSKAHA